MKKYVMAIDQGTTSSRAIIFNKKAEIITSSQKEFPQIFPKSGWVEHDANAIWNSVQSVIAEAFIESGIKPNEIDSIGITNQRETTVIWDKETGLPIYNAIVWQSRQSADIANKLVNDGYKDMIHQKTGLVVDAYFSATKIRWILDNVPGAQQRAENGELLFGTIDTWLVWKLTGGKTHVTDYTNAARTMLFNIKDLTWDKEILEILNIPESLLPEVRSNSEVYGKTTDYHFYGGEVTISGLAGDQQAALFGQLAFDKGMIKNTYGTGSFIIMNTGETMELSENNLLTTIGFGINGKVYYGTIFGLTRATTKEDLVKATLQSIAYQVRDIIDTMKIDAKVEIPLLKVDGGAANNDYLLEFQANILGVKVARAENLETTALGAAFLAGLATGYWESLDELKNLNTAGKLFVPTMEKEEREKLYKGWKRAVRATQIFAEE